MVYFSLYNNPSYSHILISSRLWSIRGQTHSWQQRSIQVFFEFWTWTNHNSLLSIATNQCASNCIDIRSRQCYFRVCQSCEIWNKKAFFLYILIFYCIKQIDPMLQCVICDLLLNRRRATWNLFVKYMHRCPYITCLVNFEFLLWKFWLWMLWKKLTRTEF